MIEIFFLESKKKRWSEDEKVLAFQYFRENLLEGKAPKKDQCIKFLKENKGKIKDRSWTAIKCIINNEIKKKE